MAAAIDNISSILECKVCLQLLRNPKSLLPCHHLFCKECLEDIMKFREDGSIDIPCPLRCPEEMHIDKNQTVNELGTSYEIKAILETLKTSRESSASMIPRCAYTTDCNKEISVDCCGHRMCNSCHRSHTTTEIPSKIHRSNGRKRNITMDEESGNLVAMCEQHLSRCTHECFGDHENNIFLCVYCLNRDHKQHTYKKTIEQAAHFFKDTLYKKSANMEKFRQIRKVTEENVSLLKTKLDKLLQQRKQECISKYIKLLNREEEIIRNEATCACDYLLNGFPSLISRDFFEKQLAKDGIDLLIDRSTIQSTIHTIHCEKKVPTLSISLDNCSDIRSDHPLGTLRWESMPSQLLCFNEQLSSTLEENITAIEFENEQLLSKLSHQMKELMNEATVSHSQLCADPSECANRTFTEDLKKVDKEGLCFIKELIDNNHVSKLRAVLAARPEALKLRGNETYSLEYTILHYATRRGTEECIIWLCTHYPYLMEVGCDAGYTPLHYVANSGQLETLRILLSCGANPHAQNQYGRTPIDEANGSRYTQCAEELLKWM